MYRERQAILSLIALGRVTPREAERLLAAWNSGREEILIVGACALTALGQSLPILSHLAHLVLPRTLPAIYHIVASVAGWMGEAF